VKNHMASGSQANTNQGRKKSGVKRDDKEQSKRFIETARKLEADESGEKFDRALKKIIRPKRPKT